MSTAKLQITFLHNSEIYKKKTKSQINLYNIRNETINIGLEMQPTILTITLELSDTKSILHLSLLSPVYKYKYTSTYFIFTCNTSRKKDINH